MRRGQQPNARRRKLNYQKSILQEELVVYNRQKEILPILGILLLFGVLFMFLNLRYSTKGDSFLAQKKDQGLSFTITQAGVHEINIINQLKFQSDSQAKQLKTELFIEKEGTKLYHYYITNRNVAQARIQKVNYYFREPGEYQLNFRHSLITTSTSNNNPIDVQQVTLTPRHGNSKLLAWGSRLFLLGLIIILLLKDYFGPAKNYLKIIKNKEYKLKSKGVIFTFILSILWLGFGYLMASSGYGFAGYNNDEHAPAESVQLDNNYYIN